VIVIAPYFPEYKVFIEKAKGAIVISESDKNTFKPNLEDLKSKINSKTKAIIINYPNNPTGVVLNENDVISLTNLIKQKEKELNNQIYLISDEPYRELTYDTKVPFITNYYDNTIICYSFSKSLSLPGERIGYILVSPNVKNNKELFYAICGAGRSLGFVCAPTLFQYMIPHVLGYTSNIEEYKENKEILYNALTQLKLTAIGRIKDSEIVSAGGVDLNEVDSKTMQSKLVKGLYFTGEVLNIDAYTGGYNLQNCWSTAWIVANNFN
jgi:aspartate aminotransferase